MIAASTTELDPAGAPFEAIRAEFESRWAMGAGPRAEAYLDRLAGRPDQAVELIYTEFCLAEAAGLGPDPAVFLRRYANSAGPLRRLLDLHGAIGPGDIRAWAEPAPDLPEPGDMIGPYRLLRELGRGSLARAYLAEQSDLDDRLVVVKVSTRESPEPRLLARAGHPHIVEVLHHASVDDGSLHLVCMPFLGGATLADVLAERRARVLGRGSGSGRDLLADLDRASAPESPPSGPGRLGRAILAGVSYPKAAAWLVARLAEALDHADRRGVTHGDLKPSNILITADAVPMLFDFNLASDWHAPGDLGAGGTSAEGSTDAGGTLAYMAPERLRALADPAHVVRPGPADRHRADLYAMGLLLREILTGLAPALVTVPSSGPSRSEFRELAAALAESRRAGHPPGAAVPRSLRPILAKCLAPDPADRYRRAAELAEDLDRWRVGLPPAFVRSPGRLAGPLGWARRRRASLVPLAACLAVGLGASGLAWRATRTPMRALAEARLVAAWDREVADVFPDPQGPSLWDEAAGGGPRDDPAAVAARRLARLDDGSGTPWRDREDVRALTEPARADVSMWAAEQAIRMARALRERPDSPDDWRRALGVLGRTPAPGTAPAGAIAREIRRLEGRIGRADPGAAPSSGVEPAPDWLESYLLGVEVEPDRAGEAFRHYEAACATCPGAFWPHFRAGQAAARLGDRSGTARHLRMALAVRPGHLGARVRLSGALHHDGRFAEALEQSEEALMLDPDCREAYEIRSKIRAALGQAEGLRAEVARYKALSPWRGELAAWKVRFNAVVDRRSALGRESDADGQRLLDRITAADPDDDTMRVLQANRLIQADRNNEAVREIDGILGRKPAYLSIRRYRAEWRLRIGIPQADGELSDVLADPRFEELLGESPPVLRSYHRLANARLKRGDTAGALSAARRALDTAERFHHRGGSTGTDGRDRTCWAWLVGESAYCLARLHAGLSQSDASHTEPALAYLRRAEAICPAFLLEAGWLAGDRNFDPLRIRLSEEFPVLRP